MFKTYISCNVQQVTLVTMRNVDMSHNGIRSELRTQIHLIRFSSNKFAAHKSSQQNLAPLKDKMFEDQTYQIRHQLQRILTANQTRKLERTPSSGRGAELTSGVNLALLPKQRIISSQLSTPWPVCSLFANPHHPPSPRRVHLLAVASVAAP